MQSRLLVPPFTVGRADTQHGRRFGLMRFLDWLEAQPGQTWQDRWNASGVDAGGQADPRWKDGIVRWLKESGRTRPGSTTIDHVLGGGLLLLIGGEVVRPSIPWMLTSRTLRNLTDEMARVRDPDGFAALEAASRDSVVSHITTRGALNRIAFILASKGGTVRDITVGDCIELVDYAHQHGRVGSGGEGSYFYQLLHAIGAFPDGAPPTARMISTVRSGQKGPEELIDRYGLACRPVRDLLVDYLRERQDGLSYASLDALACYLGRFFWRDLETHNPGISSLDLPPDVAVAWKQRARAMSRGTGSGNSRPARSDTSTPLHAVRAFYLDIARWAAEDPARWGPWAARCPVQPADIRQRTEQNRRRSRMDQRTRARIPVAGDVAMALDRARRAARGLLTAARAAHRVRNSRGRGQHCAARSCNGTARWSGQTTAREPAGISSGRKRTHSGPGRRWRCCATRASGCGNSPS